MYTIKISDEFCGAHNLRGYEGKCENLHGHNWKVEVELVKDKLDNIGMVLDFKEVKERLKKILVNLDHKYLNDIAYFKKNNPTSEIIAKYIYDLLKEKLIGINKVTIWETDTSSASYSDKS